MSAPPAWGHVEGNCFIVECCPHCGRRHYHTPEEGHRTAHCEDLSGEGYILQRRSNEPPRLKITADVRGRIDHDRLRNLLADEGLEVLFLETRDA